MGVLIKGKTNDEMKRWKEDGDRGRWSKQLIEKTIYVGDYFITEDGRSGLEAHFALLIKT